MRLRGVDCVLLVLAVRPNASWLQRTTASPREILTRFRTAWNAT
jgi:hypothetical protein